METWRDFHKNSEPMVFAGNAIFAEMNQSEGNASDIAGKPAGFARLRNVR